MITIAVSYILSERCKCCSFFRDGEYVGTATDTAVDIQASAYRCVVQHENTDATPNRLTEWGMCDLDKTGLDIVCMY